VISALGISRIVGNFLLEIHLLSLSVMSNLAEIAAIQEWDTYKPNVQKLRVVLEVHDVPEQFDVNIKVCVILTR
jgi:hypothetical protein